MSVDRKRVVLWVVVVGLLLASGFAIQRRFASLDSVSVAGAAPSAAATSRPPYHELRTADVPPTIWPQDTKRDALEGCDATAARRRGDPIRTAEAFGRNVLGWNTAVGWIKNRTRQGTAVSLYEWAGHEAPPAPRVDVWTVRVGPDCWAVGSVAKVTS